MVPPLHPAEEGACESGWGDSWQPAEATHHPVTGEELLPISLQFLS